MTDVALRLKDELLRLSEEDRLSLARILWDSIDGPEGEEYEDEAAWIAELERRSANADSGRATEQPFRAAIEELYNPNANGAWEAELERRFAEIESGEAVGQPAREAIEKLREKHK
jgi:putative addiction module component (TIGR02574 family)